MPRKQLLLVLMLGILIFVHEFGHFIVAKKTGVHVEEFALGMGPQIFKFKRRIKKYRSRIICIQYRKK